MPFTIAELIERLQSFGYKLKPDDKYSLGFITDKLENEVKNFCNITEIPDELKNTLIDAVCAEFLLEKKSGNDLSLNNFKINAALLKSISEGDTSVNYYVEGSQSAEQKLDGFINFLLDRYKKSLHRYKKLVW